MVGKTRMKESEESTSTSTATKKKACKEETTSSSSKVKKGEETTETTSMPKKKVKKAEETTSTYEKADGYSESPSESASAGAEEAHTVTPGKMTGKPQNVFVPASQISGDRMGSGKTPGQESYSGKSVDPDLMKSPLFVELSSEIDSFQKSVSKKIEAVEKSMSDRLANLQKSLQAVEDFYKKPFYKAVDENVNPEALVKKSIAEQVKEGKVRFTD